MRDKQLQKESFICLSYIFTLFPFNTDNFLLLNINKYNLGKFLRLLRLSFIYTFYHLSWCRLNLIEGAYSSWSRTHNLFSGIHNTCLVMSFAINK